VSRGFSRFAHWTSDAMGTPLAFVLSIAVVAAWAATGPLFGFSDTWQLVINTGTTVVTFWLVFVIQHTQTRDTRAMQAKLDELVRVNEKARDDLIGLERKQQGREGDM
jgi:low affinity Fe/Cu permease